MTDAKKQAAIDTAVAAVVQAHAEGTLIGIAVAVILRPDADTLDARYSIVTPEPGSAYMLGTVDLMHAELRMRVAAKMGIMV